MSPARLLTTLLVALLAVACQPNERPETATPSTTPGTAVQLWSVRDLLQEDFVPTLAAIADLGIDGVEFAGEFGPYENDAEGLRSLLDELGLRVTSAHVPFDSLDDDAIDDTVAFFQTLGAATLIIGWDDRAWDADRVGELVDDLNAAANRLANYGMNVGYHNHDREFDTHGSATFWDHIASRTREDVVLQLDVGWVVYAGDTPETYIERYPGRTRSAHYKIFPHPDRPRSPIIGDDSLDWRALTDTAVRAGRLDWIIIEQEVYPEGLSSLEAVAASKQGLDRALGR